MTEVRAITGGWQLLRAATFAVLSVGIGVLGHAALSGCAPDPLVFFLGVPLACAYALVFRGDRVGLGPLLVGVATMQVAAHFACFSLGTAPSSAAPPEHGAHMAHHVHGAANAVTQAESGSVWVMLAVHVIATLVGLAVLLKVEQLAWRTVRAVVRRIGSAFATPRPTSARAVRAPRPVGADSLSRVVRTWFVESTGRRGPPMLCAIP